MHVTVDGDPLPLDFPNVDQGIPIPDDLVIFGTDYQVTMRGYERGTPAITSMVLHGQELLFHNDPDECQLENDAGIAMFPAFSTSLQTDAQGYLTILGGGDAFVDVLASWSSTVPCAPALEGGVARQATLVAASSFRFLPDGRIFRQDTVSLFEVRLDETDPLDPLFECHPVIAPSCMGDFGGTTAVALTSYVALAAELFPALAFSSAVVSATEERVDEFGAYHTLYSNADTSRGWACAYRPGCTNDLRVGMTWRVGGAPYEYEANGMGMRVSEFVDQDAGDAGSVVFEWDHFTLFDAPADGVPARNNDLYPNQARGAYIASTAIHLGVSPDGTCGEMAAAADILDPDQADVLDVYVMVDPPGGATDPYNFDATDGGYQWSYAAGGTSDQIAVLTDDDLPVGTVFTVQFRAASAGPVTVYLDEDYRQGGNSPTELSVGSDYFATATSPTASGTWHSIYLLQPLTDGQALFLVGSDVATAPADLDL